MIQFFCGVTDTVGSDNFRSDLDIVYPWTEQNSILWNLTTIALAKTNIWPKQDHIVKDPDMIVSDDLIYSFFNFIQGWLISPANKYYLTINFTKML